MSMFSNPYFPFFQGHSWVANLKIYAPELSPAANLGGALQVNFDPSYGLAFFDNLMLNTAGRYVVMQASNFATLKTWQITYLIFFDLIFDSIGTI